ncbi:MAG: PEGA domain-containing protein [Deltaproteobacteria bacterium]|nr:PEGA domain-containing protein [Deltaproteobacteria bacterium]
MLVKRSSVRKLWIVALALLPASVQARPPAARARIAVLDLREKGVTKEVVDLLTGTVARKLQSYGIFDVLSREDLRNMLRHGQDMQYLGCDEPSCFAQLGGKIGTDYIVSGTVGMVGKRYVINLQLIEIKTSSVLERVDRQFEGTLDMLLDEVRTASHQVVAKMLEAASGALLVSVSEEGADISIDGHTVGTSPMNQLPLPAGPHDLRVSRKGFVDWARTVEVRPDDLQMVDVTLIPSAAFVADYEDRAVSMRRWAWISGAAFVALEAAALGLRIYTWQEYDPIVDAYNSNNLPENMSQREYYEAHKGDIDLAEKLDYTALGLSLAGVAAGVVSAYLFIEGEDPDRYRRFSGVKGSETAAANAPGSSVSWVPEASLVMTTGGASLGFRWDF